MQWKVREIAEARGITNARALGRAIDLSPTSIYQIWNGTALRVDMATLNKLCNLLRVPLALLLEHTPDNVEPLPGSEPAQAESSPARAARPARKSSRKARTAGAATSAR